MYVCMLYVCMYVVVNKYGATVSSFKDFVSQKRKQVFGGGNTQMLCSLPEMGQRRRRKDAPNLSSPPPPTCPGIKYPVPGNPSLRQYKECVGFKSKCSLCPDILRCFPFAVLLFSSFLKIVRVATKEEACYSTNTLVCICLFATTYVSVARGVFWRLMA